MAEDWAFSFWLNHYEQDDQQTRNPLRIKPKDATLFDLLRHKSARIIRGANHVEAHGIDREKDTWAADYAKQRIARAMNSPDSEHRDVLLGVVMFGLSARIAFAEICYHPAYGIVTDFVDPRRVVWHPGFLSPNSLRCPWVNRQLPMSVEALEVMKDAGWEVNMDKLRPQMDTLVRSGSQFDSGEVRFGYNGEPRQGDSNQPVILVNFHYEKFNSEVLKKRGKLQVLKEDERYLECPDCGFKSAPQGAYSQHMPETAPCPNCGQLAYRRDAVVPEDTIQKYALGKRLVICVDGQEKPFHLGDWPFPKMRHFPLVEWQPYRSPVDPIGQSDTNLHRSQQLIINSMYRLGYEQMLRAKGIIIAPEDGLVDWKGDPWQFSDHKDVAYYTNSFAKIDYFQPPGLNAAWPTFLQAVQNSLFTNRGTGDLGLTQDQSKDIAVGTIRTMVATGEIPVDEHIASFQQFCGRYWNRWFEATVETEQPKDVERVMGQMWAALYAKLRHEMVPGVDVIITSEPRITQENMDLAQKVAPLLNAPPPQMKLLARLAGIPESMLNEYERDMQQFMSQQQAQQMQMLAMSGAAGQLPQAQPANGAAESTTG